LQDRFEFTEGAHPEHLNGRSSPPHAAGHFIEWKPLQVAQHDDFLVIVGQLRDRFSDFYVPFTSHDQFAGAFLAGGGIEVASLGIVTDRVVQANFLVDLSLSRTAILPDEVDGVVVENRSQPGQPFGFRRPLEIAQPTMRFQQCLLHEIRRIHFGLHPTLDTRPGHHIHVGPTLLEESIARRVVAVAGLFE
jgi:hypothetical protein